MPPTLATSPPKYTQAPTSASLNSETMTEAAYVSIKFNEQLLEEPTNLHLNGLWTVDFDGRKIYYATADNIFHSAGIRPYLKQLLRYQVQSGIVGSTDPSRYVKLYSRFNELSQDLRFSDIQLTQRNAFLGILQIIAANSAIPINDIKIEISADGDLATSRQEDNGTHYILVGDELNDVSYMFVSKSPGIYRSLHNRDGITLEKIVDSFAS